MKFSEVVSEWSKKARDQVLHCTDEYKTRNALIEPFIHKVLGFDVFDIKQVSPEYNCPWGDGKLQPVDYGLLLDQSLVAMVECKSATEDLNRKHRGQLSRYFAAAKDQPLIGILTNGKNFQFYSDVMQAGKMDEKPFFEFTVLNIRDEDVQTLEKFTRQHYNRDAVRNCVRESYTSAEFVRRIERECGRPSDELVKVLCSEHQTGKWTTKQIERHREVLRRAFQSFLAEYLEKRKLPPPEPPVEITCPPLVDQPLSAATDDQEMTIDEDSEGGKASDIVQVTATAGAEEPGKKRIMVKASDVKADVQAGLSFDQIREKYGVSAEKLVVWLDVLVEKKVIDRAPLSPSTETRQ